MKKIVSILCLSILSVWAHAATRGATINLPFTENLESQKTKYTVALDTLQVNVLYKITCDINNAESSAKLLFEPRLLPSSSYGNVELNHHPLPSNTEQLQSGQNQLTFRILIGKADPEKYNQFVLNNDSEAAYQVNQCVAQEESPASEPSTNIATSHMTSNFNGGYFFAFNDTDHLVTIAVGDFFPTEYQIKAHNWRTVFVSTDNQNIRIKQIK